VVVLAIRLQVIRQLPNSLREECYLHLRPAGISRMRLMGSRYLCCLLFREHLRAINLSLSSFLHSHYSTVIVNRGTEVPLTARAADGVMDAELDGD
jgi:hypothetical protein